MERNPIIIYSHKSIFRSRAQFSAIFSLQIFTGLIEIIKIKYSFVFPHLNQSVTKTLKY